MIHCSPWIDHRFVYEAKECMCISFDQYIRIMQSTLFAFITFALLLTFVQCAEHTAIAEYEIKQGRYLSILSLVFN